MFKSVIKFKEKKLRDISDYKKLKRLDPNSKWGFEELFLTIDFDELVDQTEDHPLRKEIEIYGYEYYLEMQRECA